MKDLDPNEVMTLAGANPNEVTIQLKAADVEIASGLNKEAFARMIRLVKISDGEDKKIARLVAAWIGAAYFFTSSTS